MLELNLLNNMEFIKWCYEWITKESLATTSSAKVLKPFADEENLWWNKLINQNNNNQRTTLLCQEWVREALKKLWYRNVRNAVAIKSTVRDKKYQPDLECDDYVREVKWRNRTTPWTAWEKILGTPLKYSEVPTLYDKPLKIILVWYQEYEAKTSFACWDLLEKSGWRTKELDDILLFYKEKNIEYISFTELLKKIWLPYWCWRK